MKAKKAPVPKVQQSAQEDEDEEIEESAEGVPDFDEFLENLNSDSENEDDVDGEVEEDDGDEGDDGENEEGGSSDEELAAALEEGDEEDADAEGMGENSDESSDMEFEDEKVEEANVKAPPKKTLKKKLTPREEPNVELRPVDDESEDEVEEPDEASHQAALRNLEQTDPEFFAYLKENDAQLLDFGDEDDDDDEDSSGDEDEDGSGKKEKGAKGLHKPPTDLEVASDSEAEEELLDEDVDVVKSKVDKFLKKGVVNLMVLAEWEKKLSTTKDLTVLTNVIEAFNCAVETVLKEEQGGLKWKVKGSSHFNALVRLCIHHLKGFCVRFLLGSNNQAVAETQFDKNPFDVKEKCKSKWVKLRPKIKLYMTSLMAFLKSMGNPEAIASVLKHCQKMSGFFAIMSTKSYKLLRVLISTWATGEESCRVLAFLTIIRMANYNKTIFLTRIFKQMYMSFVSNCKFTSANSWPCINFMRSSLVEVYLLDTALSYSVAFPFIRQLAIHLRNAVTAGTNQHVNQSKKEASRIVYSWQFVHSVHLWCDLLAQALGNGDEKLKLLVYPIVQICLGTIKLIPTRKYVPLRFHIVKMLINLQDKSKIYIPILPLATEVLHLTDFSSKTVGKFSVRPLDLKCCLKADPTESGYFKAVSEAIFDTILGACKACATELAFPEIVTPTLINLKNFLKKKCKNVEISKKFKTLVEKIEANSTYIKGKRSKAMDDGQVTLKDLQSQRVLQAQMLVDTPGPPLLIFANEYFKTSERVAAKARKNNTDTREESRIPKPTSTSGAKVAMKKAKKSTSGPLFAKSDSEDDDDEDSEFKTKFDEPTITTKSNKRKAEDDSEDDDDENDDEDDEEDDFDDDDDDDSESEEEVQSKSNKSKKKKIEKPIPTFTDADYPDDMADDVVDLELSD